MRIEGVEDEERTAMEVLTCKEDDRGDEQEAEEEEEEEEDEKYDGTVTDRVRPVEDHSGRTATVPC